MSNVGFLKHQNLHHNDYQTDATPKKFANDISSVSCSWLLRKSHSIFCHFIGCKDSHFSQISQAFLSFSSLSRIIHSLTLSRNCQNAQYETFAEIPFFANDFAMKVVSRSQRTIVYEFILQQFSLVPSQTSVSSHRQYLLPSLSTWHCSTLHKA